MTIYDNLNVALLPIDIALGNIAHNLKQAEQRLETIKKPIDLAVLPELFSRGYTSDLQKMEEMAESNQGITMNAVAALAHKHNCAIVGSFLAKEEGKLYNRAFFVEPGGETTYYDKHHLFTMSDEGKMLSPGASLPPVVRFRGWNIAFAVCYDLRFPVWLRNQGEKYDLMVLPANWPDKRAKAWTTLLQARAIENLAYVIGANRSGTDEYGCYDNLSFVIDYLGYPAGEDSKGTIYASLSKSKLKNFREKFPVWKDADQFHILN